jgi:DNA-directed RNA polymerase subunit RPC12/RpoP
MEFDWPTYFECAACSAASPADAVEYDDLGYPRCPECGARTGPLASLDAVEAIESGTAD